ncbi:RnfABCDGE type electron transport complex subunit D [Candidatus Gottesmanbacteria bacterium]|nr:RnfABCDGE type electron transport complex subunit D [Candidatus Gottesmanbacteria bacterium]
MTSVLRIPKAQLALFLFLIFLSTLTHYPVFPSVFILLISLVSTISFDLLFVSIRKRTVFMPYAAIVTGLIIALLSNPTAGWYEIAAIGAIAMAAKNFIRISGRHVFNPAAIGLFIGGILFRQPVAWWGTSFQNITYPTVQNILTFIILLLPVIVSGFRLHRHWSMLAFVSAYMIFSYVSTTISPSSLAMRLLDPTVVFFATVMLPEPMTSPSNPKRQVLFGLTVAVLAQILSYPSLTNTLIALNLLPDLFIPALLLGNLLFFKLK